MRKYSELAAALDRSFEVLEHNAPRTAENVKQAAAALRELEAERDRLKDIVQDLVALAVPGQNWTDGIAAPVIGRARAALEEK